MTVFLALVLACIGSLAFEAWGSAQPISRRPVDLAVRFGGYALITLFWFQFSWRPWLAGSTCVATALTVMLIDRLKREVIGESLVFSDTALLRQVPRHPELYYTLPLSDARAAGFLVSGTTLVVLWYVFEPTILPDGVLASTLAASSLPLGFAALYLAARIGPLGRWLAPRFPRPALEDDVRRYGQLATMIVYGLRRAGEHRGGIVRPPLRVPRGADGDEVVVLVQLESFLDPTRLGGPALPAMARIRQSAAQYGTLFVPAHGAYTMRSEHAVLTGLEPDELGFGRFDPYLAGGGEEPTSLARLARSAGYRTSFVHPYHRDFFDRARVMTRLGFERLVTQGDFGPAPRVGPYIADTAFAERVLAEIRARTGKRFVFGVSMENHGPWKPGRLAGIDDPLSQYLHHVAHTGRAIEMLIDGLSGLRATLCVFGDHPPSLPANRPGSAPPRTDYAIFRFGRETGAPVRADLSVAELGCHLRGALAGEAADAAGSDAALPRS